MRLGLQVEMLQGNTFSWDTKIPFRESPSPNAEPQALVFQAGPITKAISLCPVHPQ